MGNVYTISELDQEGNRTILFQAEIPWPTLDGANVTAVLMVCKGLITLDEAVNITHLPAEHLINEAQAWAVAEAEAK